MTVEERDDGLNPSPLQKVGFPMGDKSPKNAKKSVKQKSDAKLAKGAQKQQEQSPSLPRPA